jgi:hypothetical protein
MEPIGVPMDRFQHAACWTMLRLFTDAVQVAGLAPRWIAAPGRRSFTRAATRSWRWLLRPPRFDEDSHRLRRRFEATSCVSFSLDRKIGRREKRELGVRMRPGRITRFSEPGSRAAAVPDWASWGWTPPRVGLARVVCYFPGSPTCSCRLVPAHRTLISRADLPIFRSFL